MSVSPKLGLSYLVAAQAQKEITHNEALNDLDVLVQACVVSRTLNAPPASPLAGDAYIVGSSPTGDWASHANEIAFYFSGWRFKIPKNGWQVFVVAENATARFDGSAWVMREVNASATWNPGTIANGAGVSSAAISVAGAAFGDFVVVSAPYSLQGVLMTGYVSAAGSVVVRLHNATGGSVTLASGTWKVRVFK